MGVMVAVRCLGTDVRNPCDTLWFLCLLWISGFMGGNTVGNYPCLVWPLFHSECLQVYFEGKG